MTWYPNTGTPPERSPETIAALEKTFANDDAFHIKRVFVRLRNGMEPPASWPVSTGKAQTTRWKLTGDAFDIIEWREA